MVPARLKRMLYGLLGVAAVGLAFVGAIVPGMPTTVFVLIAAFFFTRSSPRLEIWLLQHRWLGGPLRQFRQTGGMPRTAKVAALGSMWTAILISCAILAAASWIPVAAVLAMGLLGTWAILFAVRTVPESTKA